MTSPDVDGHERLSGAWNFRDVAETTGLTAGRLFRSSDLSDLDDAGRAELSSLGIGDVTDLRSPAEVSRRGRGAVPAGVVVHNLPFPDPATEVSPADGDGDAPHESTLRKLLTAFSEEDPAVAARRWMTSEYERFPTLGGARRAVRELITLLADDRPVLVHCFAGKDRTGFAVAVALEAAGADPDAIMIDYLRSNDAVGRLREKLLSSIRDREDITDEVVSFAESRLSEELLGVREDYLASARRVLDETYGGLASYLAAAEVDEQTVARLRERLRA